MRDYDGLIKSANNAMLEKLKENEHKPGFIELTLKEALLGIGTETMELSQEVFSNGALQNIKREAADVANFAAMIIYKCDKLMSEMKRMNEKTEIICSCCGIDVRDKWGKCYGSLVLCDRCGCEYKEFTTFNEDCVRFFISRKKVS